MKFRIFGKISNKQVVNPVNHCFGAETFLDFATSDSNASGPGLNFLVKNMQAVNRLMRIIRNKSEEHSRKFVQRCTRRQRSTKK